MGRVPYAVRGWEKQKPGWPGTPEESPKHTTAKCAAIPPLACSAGQASPEAAAWIPRLARCTIESANSPTNPPASEPSHVARESTPVLAQLGCRQHRLRTLYHRR